MGDKVALPSLSLPKQKTHWMVGVAIAAGVLFLVLAAALYALLQRQQAAEQAYTKHEADRAAMIKAQVEKTKAEAERAAAMAKQKEAEAAASKAAAAAAVAEKKAAMASPVQHEERSKSRSSSRRHGHRGGSHHASSRGSAASVASAPPKAQARTTRPARASQSKSSKEIDELLKSFR